MAIGGEIQGSSVSPATAPQKKRQIFTDLSLASRKNVGTIVEQNALCSVYTVEAAALVFVCTVASEREEARL
jgi:hypothetical protein